MRHWVYSWCVCALLGATLAADAGPKKSKAAIEAEEKAERIRKAEAEAEREAQAAAKIPRHPVFGIPVFEGASEASEKGLRGLGLDSAFDGYKVGAFFSNAKAEDVIQFYFKALQKTYRREKGDTTLRYTLMIEVPSGENPLGEKVVVDQNEGGVKDETGAQWKTLITVYRKIVEEKKPEAAKPEAAPAKPEGTKPEEPK